MHNQYSYQSIITVLTLLSICLQLIVIRKSLFVFTFFVKKKLEKELPKSYNNSVSTLQKSYLPKLKRKCNNLKKGFSLQEILRQGFKQAFLFVASDSSVNSKKRESSLFYLSAIPPCQGMYNFLKVENAMEVNILGLMATALFIIIPTSFLLILYVKTASNAEAQLLTFQCQDQIGVRWVPVPLVG